MDGILTRFGTKLSRTVIYLERELIIALLVVLLAFVIINGTMASLSLAKNI